MNIDRPCDRRCPGHLVCLLVAAVALATGPARGQEQVAQPQATLDDTIEAGESDAAESPRRQMVKWNEYEGPYFTIRMGGGFLIEAATYSQDE